MAKRSVYVHFSATVGSPDGTVLAPYPDFVAAVALAQANPTDTVIAYYAGFGRLWNAAQNCAVHIPAGIKNLVIRRWMNPTKHGWSGERGEIYGGVICTAFGAADGTQTNCYPVTGGPSTKPAGVGLGVRTRTTALGRVKGYYQERSTLALCNANPGSWFWNSSTSTLWIHAENSSNLQADPSPLDLEMEWFRKGDGFKANSGIRLEGLVARSWISPDSGDGYNIRFQTTNGGRIIDCIAIDCGYHAIGASAGDARNTLMHGCYAEGANYDTDTYYVFYAGDFNLSGCRYIECETAMRPLLRWDATDDAPTFITNTAGDRPKGGTAFGQHTGTGRLLLRRGVVGVRCRSRLLYPGAALSIAVSNGGASPVPADPWDPDTYGTVYEDCDFEATGVAVGTAFGDGYIGFKGGRMDFRASILTNGVVSNLNSSIHVLNGGVCLVGCTVIGNNTTVSSNAGTFVRVSGAVRSAYIDHCTFYAVGSQVSHIYRGTDAVVGVRRTIFLHETAGRQLMSGVSGVTNVSMTNCWYSGITTYGVGGASDAQSEWTALVDSTGVYGIDPQLDPATLVPLADSPLRTTRVRAASPRKPRGANGLRYSATPGACQLTPALTPMEIRDRSGRARV